jgi:hypothetical protein
MRDDMKMCLTAFVPEAVAGFLLFSYGYGSPLIYSALLLHLSAVSLALPLAHAAHDEDHSRFRRWQLGLTLAIILLVPVIGMLSVLIESLLVARLASPGSNHFLHWVSPPAYQLFRRGEDTATRIGGLREHILGAGDSPVAYRMKALLGLQSIQPRFSAPILRQVLGDSCDDLRLLAYGMLDAKEKQITRQIDAARDRYEKFDPDRFPHDHYRAAKELSELYWELVYQNLVQGDVRTHAIEQAQRYATEALKGQVYDSELRFFLGRIRLIAGDLPGAASAFEAAMALGYSPARAAPYLAEFAYLKGDYAAVRKALGSNRDENMLPSLRHAVEFWS